MKVNIKSLLNNNKFIELQRYIGQIKLDVYSSSFTTPSGVDFDKFKLSYKELKTCHNNNFLNYKSAMLKLDELYNDYSSDYSTKIEFVKEVFTCLKNEISKYILKSDNSLPSSKQNQMDYYENLRKEYLEILKSGHSENLSILLIENELKTQSIEKLITFIDNIELQVSEIKSKQNNVSRIEILSDILACQEDSTITAGNLLISQKININTDIFQYNNPKSTTLLPLLNTSSFLLNYINLENYGMLDNDIGFDGFSFFNLNTGYRIRSNSMALHQTNLSNAERDLQSNFVINENFAMALLSVHKKHMKIRGKNSLIYSETENAEQFKVVKTLFKPQFCKNDIRDEYFKDNLNLGYFVKVKRINVSNNNFEIILYYYCDQELKHGIQLFRTDKVDSIFKGLPASHILRGGEKLFTSLHMHLYNVIDATLKNPDKLASLGAMDVAYNFLNPDSITMELAEEFFNQSCGIYNKTLEKRNESLFS